MKAILKFFVFGCITFFVTDAYGQYTGPATTDKTYTVKEVREKASKLDKKDELVKVRGFIVKQINKDTYEFRDSTGTIMVEIDKEDLPSVPFNDKTELVMICEVDHDLLEGIEMEAEHIHILEKQ